MNPYLYFACYFIIGVLLALATALHSNFFREDRELDGEEVMLTVCVIPFWPIAVVVFLLCFVLAFLTKSLVYLTRAIRKSKEAK